jgi:putative ABC transport system permease protein
MKTPFIYTLKNFKARKLTTAITVVGIALVVFVFAAVLMMAYGVQKTLVATGQPDNVTVVRKSSNGEISSIVDGETQNIISTLPHIARGASGAPLITKEPVVVINLEKLDGGLSNVTVRGVSPDWPQINPQLQVTAGQIFNPNLRELIVGEGIASRFKDAQIGSVVKFAGNDWKIVGEFTTDGSGFDSEIWGDSGQLLDAFNRGSAVSSLTLKLDDAANFDLFKTAFESEQRLNEFEPKIQQQYYADQSQFLSGFIKVLGIFITTIFSLGATIGAMITMYAAVANRTREVGTLRALGFRRRSILLVFLAESLIISLLGGALGVLMASGLQFFTISTLNFDSFSELQFSFALSTSIINSSLIFALVMGVLGGFLPSIRAARLKIVDALRAG